MDLRQFWDEALIQPDEGDANALADLRAAVSRDGGLQCVVDRARVLIPLTALELDRTLIPLSYWISRRGSSQRILIGVSGAGGSGKSVLCNLIACVCNALPSCGDALTLSMDAYHFPNAHLQNHVCECDDYGDVPRGTQLSTVKGHPLSMDVDSFVDTLRRLKSADTSIGSLPVYDRVIHDPVAAQIPVSSNHRIVLCEGLHLTHRKGAWASFGGDLLDALLHINTPLATCRHRLVSRKQAQGKSAAEALAWFAKVDLPMHAQIRAQSLELECLELELGIPIGTARHLSCSAAAAAAAAPRASIFLQKGCLQLQHVTDRTGVYRGRLCGRQSLLPTANSPSTKMRRPVVIGLNAALQKRMSFKASMALGGVNRAEGLELGVGGKGQGAATTLHLLFSSAQPPNACGGGTFLLGQFLGGTTGTQIQECQSETGVPVCTQQTAASTRTCITLLDTREGACRATELVEPSGAVQESEAEGLLAKLSAALRGTRRRGHRGV